MSANRESTVAVIGLGAIGLPVAVNLAKKGSVVQGFNRSEKNKEIARAAGVVIKETLAEVDAKIIFTVLPDMPQVTEVLENGLRNNMKPGDIFVVMGTVSPVAMKKLATELEAQGIRVLDAPVSGGDVGAKNGTLSIMVGGEEAVFNAALPYFEQMGTTIRLLGPVGSGEFAKAANQIIVAITLTALAEAVTLGRNSGLDTTVLLDILAGGLAGSQALKVKREKIESHDFTPGGSSIFQLKDLRFALEAGAENGTALPITKAVTELYSSLVEHGDGALDHSAIIREIERLSREQQH